MSYTQEGRSFFLLGNCFTQYVSWLSLLERIPQVLKMILVSFRGKPMFLISSEKILRVVLCSILDSLYFGHILTKNEGSALPPWLFILEAVLRSATVTILPHHSFANGNRGPSPCIRCWQHRSQHHRSRSPLQSGRSVFSSLYKASCWVFFFFCNLEAVLKEGEQGVGWHTLRVTRKAGVG